MPCSTPTNNKEISLQLLQGSWNWHSEEYLSPINGQYTLKTPISEGYSKQLVFKNSTELEFFKNNISLSKYLYEISQEFLITRFPGDKSNVLVFNVYPSGIYADYVHFKVCNDTLILNFQITTDLKGKEKWAKN